MGLFTKYKENQTRPVSGSVIVPPPGKVNTLFNGSEIDGSFTPEKNIIQTSPRQDVNIGRVESNLFKSRQKLDEQRIREFLATPGGKTHIQKEVNLARVNPVFTPGLGRTANNPTRTITANRVAINAGLSGGGTFGDKFGVIGGVSKDGYIKYSLEENKEKSKLYLLSEQYKYFDADPFPESSLSLVGQDLTNLPSKFEQGLTNFTSTFSNVAGAISNFADNLSRFTGKFIPNREEMYSYSGGAGSNNGIGSTVIYKYNPIQFDTGIKNFYNLERFKNNSTSRKKPTNFESNDYWYKGSQGVGNLINNQKRPSRFLNTRSFDNFIEGYNPSFISKYTNPLFAGWDSLTSYLVLDKNGRKPVKVELKPYISNYYDTISNKVDSAFTSKVPNHPENDVNPYYESGSFTPEEISDKSTYFPNFGKDIIPFRIEIIDLAEPSKSYYLYFKAFIDSFDDNFSATHDVVTSPGNPAGKIFKYNAFSRDLRLSFKIVSFSRDELDLVYKKINRLAATTLPYRTSQDSGVRTVISKLTVGNWCKKLPGIITSINFTNIMDYPWDIDEQLPMVINVNMGFVYSSAYEDNSTSRPSVRSFAGGETILLGDNVFEKNRPYFGRSEYDLPALPPSKIDLIPLPPNQKLYKQPALDSIPQPTRFRRDPSSISSRKLSPVPVILGNNIKLPPIIKVNPGDPNFLRDQQTLATFFYSDESPFTF